MSALGHYIHLTTTNYLKYGVNEPSEGVSSPYIPIQNFLIERTAGLTTVNQATIDTLKLRIAADSETKEKRDKLGMQKKWQRTITDIYKQLAQFTSSNLIGRLQGEKEAGTTRRNLFTATSAGYKKAKSMAVSATELAQKKQIKDTINQLIKKVNTSDPPDMTDIQAIVNLYKQLDLEELDELDAESTLGKIQSALVDLVFDTQYNALVGDFGEYLVYSARDVSNSKARQMADNAIEGIVGRETSAIKFSKESIAVDLNKFNKQTFTYADPFTKSEYIINKTQDKVDVNLIVNQEDLFASVKNYKDVGSDSKVKLQTVDIFTSLLYLNYLNDFGNHWLNMHAANRPEKINQAYLKNADEVLKQEFAYEALVSGNPLKQNTRGANIFIVIDRFSGKVFAESTKNILTDPKLFNNISMSSDISTVRLPNKFSNSPEQRIADILLTAHQTKVKVGYKVSL